MVSIHADSFYFVLYPTLRFLMPPKHSGGEGNLDCGARSGEKLHLKNATVL